MPIKRGTIVEFIGTELTPDSPQYAVDYKKRILKEFFDKHGLQPGDRAKIWEGYRGSWIRITWTLQDGTTAYRVPMRSGNFKVVGHPSNISDNESLPDLESEDDSVPELQPELAAALDARLGDARRVDCFESDGTIAPQKLIEDLRKILKQTRAENEELKTLCQKNKEEIIGLDTIAAMRADQMDGDRLYIDQMALENEELRKKNMLLGCEHFSFDGATTMEKVQENYNQLKSTIREITLKSFPAVPIQPVVKVSDELRDTCARDQIKTLTKAMSDQALISDAQQKILKNLKSKLDQVNLHGSQTNELAIGCLDCLKLNGMVVGEGDTMRMVDKDKQDKAAIALQDVAQEYLVKKREDEGDWVVPEIGSG